MRYINLRFTYLLTYLLTSRFLDATTAVGLIVAADVEFDYDASVDST